jgi:hypothetical protein
MSQRLHPCPTCARHLRAGEIACPFCGAAIAAVPLAARRAPKGGAVTRAALLFAGATAVAACGSTTTGESIPDAGGPTTDGTTGGGTSGSPEPVPLPMYGAAVVDAGHDAGDASPTDAGTD